MRSVARFTLRLHKSTNERLLKQGNSRKTDMLTTSVEGRELEEDGTGGKFTASFPLSPTFNETRSLNSAKQIHQSMGLWQLSKL